MIITEHYAIRDDGVELERTFSSEHRMIQNVSSGAMYDYVINPINSGREYIETNLPIDDTVNSEEALNILLGVRDGQMENN